MWERRIYGILSDTTYKFKLPVPYNNRLCGSSHGWLAKVDYCSEDTFITFFNPFNDTVSICLLPIYIEVMYITRKYFEYDVHKVVLSTNPTFKPHDYIVVVIYSVRKCLAFLKVGQTIWTFIDDVHGPFNDVIFYKSLVYTVGLRNDIVSFDLSSLKDNQIIPKVVSLKGDDYAHRAYLIKSLEEDLWLVRKFVGFPSDEDDEDNIEPSGGTERFEVYNLELDLQTGKLIQMLKIDSLRGNVLFLGDNDSVAVSASCFYNYLEKDSIYYMDDFYDDSPPYPNGSFDMEIYNVKKENFNQRYPYHPRFRRMPPALWIIPPF